VLREKRQDICEEEVDYAAGKNRYTLPLYLREAGYYEYVATSRRAAARTAGKRTTRPSHHLSEGRGTGAAGEGRRGDERDWRPLADALKKSDRAVQVADSYEVPHDALSLLPYDCVIFVNVAAEGSTRCRCRPCGTRCTTRAWGS